ncbi:MAG: cytochrome P450 [Deltaproteobacteria bacterium]|nr:MAG: cytochrome P450 [Deltaproteobacteria bacterium]
MTSPGPSEGLGIGRFLRLSKDPLGFLTALRQHGTFVRYRLGPRTLHLVSDPEIVHEVLVAKASSFHKDRGTEMMRPLLGRGLLTSEDEQHRRQRRALQPAFHKARVAHYAQVMAEEALRARDALPADEEVDVLSLAMRTTFAIVGRALFGTDVAGHAPEVQRALADAMSVFTLARVPVYRLLLLLPLPSTLRFARARDTLRAVVDRIVREHGASGFFSLAEAAGLSGDELRDTALTLLLAGHETTAVALCWTLYLLSQHPAAAARLEAEIDSTLEGRAPQATDLERLPYLQRVVSESMRLFPPAWAVGRLAQEDVELSGRIVRQGETIIISQWVMHRDAALWPDPLRFDPDRFERPPVHRFAYLPFGAGPRVCIGDGFAWAELILLLATLAQSFRFRLATGQRIEPLPRVTLRLKYGLRMIPVRRSADACARQAAIGSGFSGSGSSSSTGSQW